MSEWIITATAPNGEDREKTLQGDEDDAKSKVNELKGLGFTNVSYQEAPEKASDGGAESVEPEVVEDTPQEVAATTEAGHEVINDPEKLSEDPIGWLEGINNSFVNTIKGTPAISKQGFRFIQAQFGITTESEMVEWVDDPTGCVVWAKAELPDGQSAEAHGEGYLSESGVDDNEFVRYADTRAKNRAISDLTSAGALAVSELSKEQ